MITTEFNQVLKKKLKTSFYNNFGKENYDELRFGEFQPEIILTPEKIKEVVKRIINYKIDEKVNIELLQIEKYQDQLARIWNSLNEESKGLWINIIAYRIMGRKKIKLPLNTADYKNALEKVKHLKTGNDKIDPHFIHFILEKFNLHSIGYNIELFFFDLGIVTDFIVEQYAHKSKEKYIVQAEKGDTVLDIGACWGDTALYFADKVGKEGKVFSFEFIPNNINIYNINIALNPNLKHVIQLVPHPVSDVSDEQIFYQDNGPGSRISQTSFETQTGSAFTLSIDDFVERYQIDKVDFIKMDIEGAEPAALRGALQTIKKYKPKLAIAIYHSIDDLVNIPNWLIDLNLEYEFYIGHHTIHAEETLIYANPIYK